MTIYESKTNKYRIRKEVRLSGKEYFYPEKRKRTGLFNHIIWWEGYIGYLSFDDALKHITDAIVDDNKDYENKHVISSEIL